MLSRSTQAEFSEKRRQALGDSPDITLQHLRPLGALRLKQPANGRSATPVGDINGLLFDGGRLHRLADPAEGDVAKAGPRHAALEEAAEEPGKEGPTDLFGNPIPTDLFGNEMPAQ